MKNKNFIRATIGKQVKKTPVGNLIVKYRRKKRSREIDRKLKKLLSYDKLPFFNSIEIETLNRCNGSCSFCPVNVNEKQRPYAKMNMDVFYKIINELSDVNYTGKIALYSNNEPFLDDRIVEMHKYARGKLPKAFFSLYTNGSVLRIDQFMEMKKYLDEFVIDNYNDTGEVNENLKDIYEYIQKNKRQCSNITFSFRLQNEVLLSRGGQSPNKKNVRVVKPKRCSQPFDKMIVRPDGGVSLCCNDALGVYTMGNVLESSLIDIWYGEKFVCLRKTMLKKGRDGLKLCENCDG